MSFALALISLAEAPAARSGYTDMLKSGTASLHHLARFGSVAVWRMAGLLAAVLEPVWVLEEGRSPEIETERLVAEALEEVRPSVRLENVEVVAPESQRPLGRCQHPHRLSFRSVPCFQIAPLPDQLHASLALLRPLVAPESSFDNSPSAQAFPSLCMHSWQSRQVEAANLMVAETYAEG